MRTLLNLRTDWAFTGPDGSTQPVTLPHTWNAADGQDGGNDYWRGTCTYQNTFSCPAFDPQTQRVYLEFQGVNASARVLLNGQVVGRWKTKDRKLTVEVFTALSEAERRRIEEAANTLWASAVKEITFT